MGERLRGKGPQAHGAVGRRLLPKSLLACKECGQQGAEWECRRCGGRFCSHCESRHWWQCYDRPSDLGGRLEQLELQGGSSWDAGDRSVSRTEAGSAVRTGAEPRKGCPLCQAREGGLLHRPWQCPATRQLRMKGIPKEILNRVNSFANVLDAVFFVKPMSSRIV